MPLDRIDWIKLEKYFDAIINCLESIDKSLKSIDEKML